MVLAICLARRRFGWIQQYAMVAKDPLRNKQACLQSAGVTWAYKHIGVEVLSFGAK